MHLYITKEKTEEIIYSIIYLHGTKQLTANGTIAERDERLKVQARQIQTENEVPLELIQVVVVSPLLAYFNLLFINTLFQLDRHYRLVTENSQYSSSSEVRLRNHQNSWPQVCDSVTLKFGTYYASLHRKGESARDHKITMCWIYV